MMKKWSTARPSTIQGYNVIETLAEGVSSVFVVRRETSSNNSLLVLKQSACGGLAEANLALQEALNMARLSSVEQVVHIEDVFLTHSGKLHSNPSLLLVHAWS